MSSPPQNTRRSDRPRPINRERDEFIRTFFSKGVRFTQELLREHENLNQHLAEIEQENAALRLQIKSDHAIRELLSRIAELETEKAQLATEVRVVEEKSTAVEMTYSEVESELANLAGLYVASRQLHSTTSVSGAVRQVNEILEQLVGAKVYAIHFLSDDATCLVRIASRGLRDDELCRVSFHDGILGEVFLSGQAHVAEEGNLAERNDAHPAACIPLRIADRVVGIITIFAMLEQKARFLPVDYEFFKLLSGHAAFAIVAARLFADADRQVPGIESFFEHGV